MTASGGIALLLPPQDPDAADAAIAGMDGLILSGVPTSRPSSTARSGIRSPTPPASIAMRGSSPCSGRRSGAGCRCSRSAVVCSS
nr:hypothetical protein [Microbacterium sp. Se63.02b]